ncbi:Mov34/MPN/PAD-1 family protein [Actinomadura sp. K4S16]|uniref:Mov34/MPN/PAD-1 family protein n=1 Tax=Actinomadura sp. K4S16 TaxID=1316147 RepID=UPI001F26E0DE|nr:M67 family metallopeptidase [Actinomadura sp. K4S16]
MGLVISGGLLDAIVEHARSEHPFEACGIVAGPAGSGRPVRHVPMANASGDRRRRFRFDPEEQLAVWREMDARGEDPVVVYHSHPRGGAYPSREDVRAAWDPGVHYLIVSLRGGSPEVRSFRVGGGCADEEPVTLRG